MIRSLSFMGFFLIACSSTIAQSMNLSAIDAPAEPTAIPLETGGVEGASVSESWFALNGQASVRNVQQATLTPVLPKNGNANGAAVIVAPGGGFLMLSMENEGWPVARWLADHGIAAFVLKYRLRPTPSEMGDFQEQLVRLFSSSTDNLAIPVEPIVDGEAALRLVRARSKEWGVDPARVGMLGFSAGAITALQIALKSTPETTPAFIAPIYGPMNAVVVPAAAPPIFVVLAADDPLFANKGLRLIENWSSAKRPIEFHLYQKGGHGFGMGQANTTTSEWMKSFYHWLEMNEFLTQQAR